MNPKDKLKAGHNPLAHVLDDDEADNRVPATRAPHSLTKREPKPQPAPPPAPEPIRTTIILHQTELDVVDRIIDVLSRNGHRNRNVSKAIKIALRLCTTDPNQILATSTSLDADDRRRKK